MQVVLHAGAHMTDEDRLIKCLSDNRGALSQVGSVVPSPSTYRKVIRDLLQEAQRSGITEDARDVILSATRIEDTPERLILSSAGFFGTPKMSAAGGTLYSAAEGRLAHLQQMFPHDRLELFLAIRNPATFLPAVFERTSFDSIADFLHGTEPSSMRWSDMIGRVRQMHPDLSITVWCYEDLPLLWSQVLREMGGLDPTTALEGEFSLLEDIMSVAGMQRFNSYLGTHPDMTEVQKRRVIVAFLDKFAQEEAIEEELDVPGWTHAVVDQLTDIYDDDTFTIQRIPGVNLITP